MANEFKIKNGLLVEGSTNSVPVLAIRNSSTGINADASSLLFTGKAIFDYVSSQAGSSTLAGLADVQITSISDNQFLRYDYDLGKWINVSPTEASLYFWSLDTPLVRESSLGADFYWEAGLLEVSIATGVSSLSSLTDVSIISIADNDLLQYDLASGKWKNVALTDASNYFWLSSIPLLREASLGTGFAWNAGLLDISVIGGGAGLSTIEVSSNYTALSNYIILANSSYNSFDITLPASPANGDIIAVVDVMKSSSTNNINILRNGHLINKLSENFTIDVNGGGIQLIYHSLDNNFAIQNLETLVGYKNSSTAESGVSQAYVDGSLATRDGSINLLFLQMGDISTALGAILG